MVVAHQGARPVEYGKGGVDVLMYRDLGLNVVTAATLHRDLKYPLLEALAVVGAHGALVVLAQNLP